MGPVSGWTGVAPELIARVSSAFYRLAPRNTIGAAMTVKQTLVALALITVAMIGLARFTSRSVVTQVHPHGTELVVGYHDAESGARTQLGLTVLDVREGTPEELAANGLELGADVRATTPYYVDLRVVNRGPNALSPSVSVGFEDRDRELVQEPIVFFSNDEAFQPCPGLAEAMLEPGDRLETCDLVFVPDGVDAARVYYHSDRGPGEPGEFVYWELE
jgi:hypothetical protein